MVIQYGTLYQDTRRALLETESAQDAGLLARMLICHVSGKDQARFLADRDLYAPEEVVQGVAAGLERLQKGEPIAYILGQWEFYGLPLRVTPDVLIPRDDTCAVAELAVRQALFLEQNPRILDLCCGSGCIGLAVAKRVKDAKVTLADLSQKALAIARENTAMHKLGGRVRSIRVDAMEPASPFLGKFDMIISNPPYVTKAEMAELPVSVRDYEPHMALYGGEDGLDFYRAILRNFTRALRPGGYLCLEFGMGQGDAVCALLRENDYTVLERAKDFNDRERAVLAQYGRKEE